MGKRNWLLNIDGIDYDIEYTWSMFSKNLSVNGQDIPITKPKFLAVISEIHFSLDAAEIILVHRGFRIDLALEGKYISSNNDFTSIGNIPKWAWIFITLNGLILLSFKAVPGVFALISMLLSVLISISSNFKTILKIIFCSLVTIALYELSIILVFIS